MKPSDGFELTSNTDGGYLVVQISGRIGYPESDQFQTQMDDLLAREEKMVLFDCANLSFISSAGLKAILLFAKQAPDKGKTAAFYGLQENVAHVFDISGFTKILSIFPDKAAAIAGTATEK